ncbi:MAG TPA: metallophosphoesterase family protein, partial [Chloroflexia bacterium]|nr:metallophosphoesterase family protein [Chloroflexia bacterium]
MARSPLLRRGERGRQVRIGIISDLHGNYVALRTVLEEMGAVDQLWCLGDLVGYGPQPNECIEAVREQAHICIPGNHDWGMLGRLDILDFNRDARIVLDWTRRNLTPESLEWMEALPVTLKAFGQAFTLVHASPRDPMWEYLLDLFDAAECFPLFDTRYCFVGHTHVPIIFRDVEGVVKAALPEPGEGMMLNVWPKVESLDDPGGARMIVNPGSVGQPRDGDPRAAYMVLDIPPSAGPEADWKAVLTFHRTEYPVDEVQDVMKGLNFPPRLIQRLELG